MPFLEASEDAPEPLVPGGTDEEPFEEGPDVEAGAAAENGELPPRQNLARGGPGESGELPGDGKIRPSLKRRDTSPWRSVRNTLAPDEARRAITSAPGCPKRFRRPTPTRARRGATFSRKSTVVEVRLPW